MDGLSRTAAHVAALASIAVAGCVADGAIATGGPVAAGGPQLRFALTADTGCVDAENDDRQFPSNADRVIIRVTGGTIPADEPHIAVFGEDSLNAAGQLTVEEIPEGDGLRVAVMACQGSEATWAGATQGLSIVAGEASSLDLFLTPVGDVACVDIEAQSAMPAEHMYAVTAVRKDAAWILGGFANDEDGDPQVLVATSGITRYDAPQGTFTDLTANDGTGSLEAGRAMAGSTWLTGGRLLIVGGTTRLRLFSPGSPPLWAHGSDAPYMGVEVFNTHTGMSSPGPSVALPALPAVVELGKGRILAVGGVGSDDEPSDEAWLVDESGALVLQTGAGRFGASISAMDDQRALVWGGRLDGHEPGIALWVDASVPSVEPLVDVSAQGDGIEPGQARSGMPLFSSTLYVGSTGANEHQFLVVGGTEVHEADGWVSYDSAASTARMELVTLNPKAGWFRSKPVDLTGVEDEFRRAGASLVAVPGDSFWLVGGFTNFAADDACGGAAPCLQTDTRRFGLSPQGTLTAPAQGPTVLEAAVGPLGSSITALEDGSWLVTGGLVDVVDPASAITRDAVLIRHGAEHAELCVTESLPE